MDDAHIIVAGSRRSGTRWLSDMLRVCVAYEERKKHVTHEALKQNPMRMFANWRDPGVHIEVGHTHVPVLELKRQFPDLQIRIIVRDPLDHIESMCTRHGAENEGPGGAFNWSQFSWAALDQLIRRLKAADIAYDVWHFDYYTTLLGFKAFAESLGLTLRDDWEKEAKRARQNASPSKVSREEWPELTCTLVQEFFDSLEMLKPAYDEARRS